MKQALAIFTGIHFSHYLADHAIAWAAQTKVELHILFLRAGREKEEGYGFPSDLDAAEKLTTHKEAEKDDLKLIRDYEKLLKHLGKEKNVRVTEEIMTDPSPEQVFQKTKNAEIVFIEAGYNPEDVASPKDFSIEALQEESHAPVELVTEREK